MIQDPDPLLIDRAMAAREVEECLGPALDVLQDQVGYMSEWIIRLASRDGTKPIEDVIVIGVLLKHAFMMLEAVEILCRRGLAAPAYLQGRSFFESAVYIQWIMEDRSQEKARAYYLWDLKNERRWNARMVPGSERDRFLKVIGPIRSAMKLDDEVLERAGRNRMAQIDSHLRQPAFESLDKKYGEIRKKDAWYAAIGPKALNTFRDVCEAVDRLPEYELFYSPASNIAHASSVSQQLALREGRMALKPITSTPIVGNLLKYVIRMATQLLREVITHYEPAGLDSFRRRYIGRWRQPFLEMPVIKEEISFEDLDPTPNSDPSTKP